MRDELLQMLELGYQAQQSGDLGRAEEAYLQVLEEDSHNIHALNLMGMLCVNAFRSVEAVDYISRALQQVPDNPQSHTNIGLAYKDQGNAEKAAQHFNESIRIDPGNPDVHNNLGNVLRAIDKPKQAIRSYEKALQLHRDFAECWSNLAAALNETDQQKPALKAVGRALELAPDLAQAYNNRGDIYLSEARYEDALADYKKATALSPTYVAALINMARVQRDMDLPDDAEETLQQALDLEPDNPEALLVQGVLCEQMGDRAGAVTSFKAAIEATPEMTVAHYYLSQIRGRQGTDAEFDAMRALNERTDLNDNSRMYLGFGLYRAHEQREEYDEAFRNLAAANRIKAENTPYDDEETAHYIESIVESARSSIQRLGARPGFADSRPVFVLGMPRSGTSLTEQILASHTAVAGAGELSFAYDTAHTVRGLVHEKFPDNMKLLTAEQYAELGESYLARHSEENLAAQYVVDKTPLNFQYIGLLGLALPDARFVHCHRDPIANCFSIHRMPFDEKQTYAHSLEALGKYYTRYWRFMQSWHEMFPGRILDMKYEDTVADIETQSRRMLEFLDLPFEEEVLEYHKTKRLVKTPSASQVRQPIYKDRIAAWKKYENYLRPLIDNIKVSEYE
ncbi:MAG: sulfotransferase [Gammaproteobacteria bacterium]|nr:sulfotransferase [Gammaproteobacteria bacterium]